jgi:glycosyltransferase involved in cell wall biosynthesis
MVRVLYFSDNTSGHNRRFLEKISSFGHEVWFLDFTGSSMPGDWLPRGVRCVRLKVVAPREADPSFYQDLVPQFQELLRELRPDLVHAGPLQSCGYVAALSGFSPLLLMSWGSDILLHANRNEQWKQATVVALGGAAGFFCDCDAARLAAKRIAPLPDSHIVQLPWGIQRGRFLPKGPKPPQDQLVLDPQATYFISTRSWESIYDIGVLLEAFNQAYQANRGLRLLLLGHGSEACRIHNFIETHNLAEVVLRPGLVPSEELPRWFRAANAYISCAKSDGTSISLLEAMATGLPVVTADLLSNREWITEGQNGWLAPVGSAERFAERMLRAANLSVEEKEAISRRNQQIVCQRADWDRNFPALMDMYERLLDEAVRKQ